MSRKNPRSITNNPNTQSKKIKQEFALLLEELRLWMWFILTTKKFTTTMLLFLLLVFAINGMTQKNTLDIMYDTNKIFFTKS